MRRTWVHFAAQEHHVEIALVLDAGASVDGADSYGNTPLGRATFESRGRGEMIRLLIGRGADADLPNNAGISPRQLAQRIANYDLQAFFG